MSYLLFFLDIIMMGFYLIRRYKKGGVFDLGFLLGIFLLFYNSFVSISFYIAYNHYQYLIRYPQIIFSNFFDYKSFPYPAFLGTIAIFGLFIQELFSPFKKVKIEKKELFKNNNTLSIYFKFGFIFFIIGMIFYFINLFRFGGFLSVIKMQRMSLYQELSSARGFLPYSIFIFPGIASMLIGAKYTKNKKKLYLTFSLIIIWILITMFTGDRRYILYTIMITGYIFFIEKTDDKKFLKIFIVGILIFYLLFAYFEKTRVLIPYLMSGQYSFKWALDWMYKFFLQPWYLPLQNELGGPYLTLLYYLSKGTPFLLGKTYFYAIVYLFPRLFLPFEKLPTISQEFSILIHNEYLSTSLTIKGWGFNPVAEAYINFGFIGPFIIFFILSFFIDYIQNKFISNLNYDNLLIFSNIVCFTFTFNRTGFAELFQELVFLIIGCYLLINLIKYHLKREVYYEDLTYN